MVLYFLRRTPLSDKIRKAKKKAFSYKVYTINSNYVPSQGRRRTNLVRVTGLRIGSTHLFSNIYITFYLKICFSIFNYISLPIRFLAFELKVLTFECITFQWQQNIGTFFLFHILMLKYILFPSKSLETFWHRRSLKSSLSDI